jgi:hypothetical protein
LASKLRQSPLIDRVSQHALDEGLMYLAIQSTPKENPSKHLRPEYPEALEVLFRMQGQRIPTP